MATGGLYGSTSTGTVAPQSGSESVGLYGNNTSFGGSYFEWFIFQVSSTAPATPTGGSWSFVTNSGTPPTGWLAFPPANPDNIVWVSIGLVNSKSTTSISWSAPGKFSFASGLPILSGTSAPTSGVGQTDQLYIQTSTTPETIWFKQAGTWTALTGSSLYVDLTNNQTIAGTKTFSSAIAGSVTGTSNNVTGVVDITNGGTGSTSASAARTALGLGTISTQAANNVSITGGSISGLTTDLAIADGGTGASTASDARTNLGATTLGANLFTATNPSAITFPRFNADNSVSSLDASTFRTAIGAGTSSTTGTVTSVAATVPSLLSVTGSPITSSGTLAISYSGTALPIANGGTGQTSAVNAFDALSPTTTKGDLIVSNGTDNVRLAVGTNAQVLVADSTEATGVKWATNSAGSSVAIADEGTTLTSAVASINFTGAGVTATNVGSAVTVTIPGGSGSGDVVGPASATDNAVVRFDTTTGKLIQNSVTTIDDTGNASGILSQQFSDGTAVTLAAGKIWYNGTTGSWNAGMGNGNITQQIGEELYRYGKASAAITDSPLQLVYKTGTVGASGVITFAPAAAGITDSDQIIGCATESIALNGFGRVTTYGIVNNITTNGTAYSETWADNDDIYYNPTTGGLTKTLPSAPGLKVLIGTVIKAGSGGSGSFIVKLGAGTSLARLSDAQVTSPTGGQLLTYNQTGGYWKNTTLTDGTVVNITETTAGAVTIDLISAYGDTLNPYASKTAAYVLAAPSSAAGVPSFRALVSTDIPTLNQNTTGTAAGLSATLAIASGGTGATTLAGASIPTYSSTDTLTNKRITARVNALTTTTSPWGWDSTSYDQQSFSALANALTISLDINTTLTDGQKTILRFKDNGTARVITFTGGSAKGFRPIGATMTVSGSNFTYTTTANKTVYFGCIYNSADSRWDIVSISQEV